MTKEVLKASDISKVRGHAKCSFAIGGGQPALGTTMPAAHLSYSVELVVRPELPMSTYRGMLKPYLHLFKPEDFEIAKEPDRAV